MAANRRISDLWCVFNRGPVGDRWKTMETHGMVICCLRVKTWQEQMLSKLTNSKSSSGILWYSEVYSKYIVMTINIWTEHPFPWTFQSCARTATVRRWCDKKLSAYLMCSWWVQPIRKKRHMTNIDQQFKSQETMDISKASHQQWLSKKTHTTETPV